ncbi:MAG: ChbG/HpnK family deacetylase [Gemmatimonadota bacterium]|nr:ChbG/HpnK family deacetylase [Gemmatimonadota bacterium]
MAATPDRPRLIINADDFGFSEGVTRGIVEAFAAGSVTSTSIMANGVDWENAVRLARANPKLGVGVHLNLVQGRPLLRVPSLTDAATGELHSLGALARRAWAGRVDAGELEAETRAQIERVRGAGIAVTHLDSHRHSHLLAGIWPIVSRVTRDAGIRVIRIPREPFGINALDAAATPRKLVLAMTLRLAHALPLPSPLKTTDHFRGISLQGGTHFASRLRRTLDTLEPGSTELMVHPGHVDASLAAQDPYTAPREIELAELLSAGVRERLSRGDIELTGFAAL